MWQDKSDIKVGLFCLFNVQVLGIQWVLASEWRTLTNLTPSISRFIHNSTPPSYKPTSFDKFLTTKEVKNYIFFCVTVYAIADTYHEMS